MSVRLHLFLRPAAPALPAVWLHKPINKAIDWDSSAVVKCGAQGTITPNCHRGRIALEMVFNLPLCTDLINSMPPLFETQGEIFGGSVLCGLSFIHVLRLEAAVSFCGFFQSHGGHQHVPKG